MKEPINQIETQPMLGVMFRASTKETKGQFQQGASYLYEAHRHLLGNGYSVFTALVDETGRLSQPSLGVLYFETANHMVHFFEINDKPRLIKKLKEIEAYRESMPRIRRQSSQITYTQAP